MLQPPFLERKKLKCYLLMCIAFVAPISFSLFLNFFAPRPFFIMEDDAESVIYASLLLYSGQPVFQISHPGTPIHYLVYLVMLAMRPDLTALQPVFTVLHLMVSLFTAASLCIFVWLLLEDYPIGIAVLALASILAWPGLLTYLDYFEMNSFLVPFGLSALAVFWRGLEQDRDVDNSRLIVCGIILGLCLATKLSSLPLAAAIITASWFQVLPFVRTGSRRWTSLLIMPLTVALTFFLFTLPIFGRVPNTILGTILRHDTKPESWNLPRLFRDTFRVLIHTNLPLAMLLTGTTILFFYLSAKLVLGRRKARRSLATSGKPVEEGFAYLPGGVLLSLMILSFFYTMACASPGSGDPGMLLSNVGPNALALPFLILYCYRLSRRLSSANYNSALVQGALVVAAIVIVVFAVSSYVSRRQAVISSHLAARSETRNRLEILRQPGTRIAFWDGSPGDFIGEESFHFWGNYSYGNDYFDQLLLQKYPHYTFLRLREVPEILEENAQGARREIKPRGSSFGWPGVLWRQVFPYPFPNRTNEIVAGEMSGVRVSVIAFPEDEAPEGGTESEILSLIHARFGNAKLWKESIAGVNWIIISVSSSPSGSSPP
jgi:hypothetical protein